MIRAVVLLVSALTGSAVADSHQRPVAEIIQTTIAPCWPLDPVYDQWQVSFSAGLRLGPDAQQLGALELINSDAEPTITQRGLRHLGFALSACRKELTEALPWGRYAEWRDTVVTITPRTVSE